MIKLINSNELIYEIKSIGNLQYSNIHFRNNDFLTTARKNQVKKIWRHL